MSEFHALTVMLKVTDIRAAIAFYTSIGFMLAGTDEFHYGESNINWARLENGAVSLMLSIGGDDKPKPSQDFFLRVEDVDAFYALLKDKVTIRAGLRDQFCGMRDFWFIDPLGYHWGAGHPVEAESA